MNRSSDEERSERIRRYNLGEAAAKEDTLPESAAPPKAPEKAPSKARLALILLACLFGSVAVSYVVFKLIFLANVPNELVGKWQVADGPLRGALLQFHPDGAVVATLTIRGKTEVTHQTARVEGKKLLLTAKDPDSKKGETVVQMILSLTDDDLVLRDEEKRTYHLKRVHE